VTQICIFNYFLDEVESLTAARAGAMAGTEPSDGLRVSLLFLYPALVLITSEVGGECIAYTARQVEASQKCFGDGHKQSRESYW
jgi:hypothetical protein